MNDREIILLVPRFIHQVMTYIRSAYYAVTMLAFSIIIWSSIIQAGETDPVLKPSDLNYAYSPDEINFIKQKYNDILNAKVFIGCMPEDGCHDDKEWLKIRYIRGSPSEYAEPMIFLQYRSKKGNIYNDIISTRQNFELFENQSEPRFAVEFDLSANHLSIVTTPQGFVHHLSEKSHSRL